MGVIKFCRRGGEAKEASQKSIQRSGGNQTRLRNGERPGEKLGCLGQRITSNRGKLKIEYSDGEVVVVPIGVEELEVYELQTVEWRGGEW